MIVGIIDLGTNTFNLLIVESNREEQKRLFKTKIPVRLGEGGMEKKNIQPAAFERGISALKQFKDIGKARGVQNWVAYGTSALRTAKNAAKFIAEAKKLTGLEITIIPGFKEAEFIYRGVKAGIEIGEEPVLILDIGGGSNEFIIANSKEVFWKESVDLGMQRLMEKFKIKDPFNETVQEKLTAHFDAFLKNLETAIALHKPKVLIGAAGSFESFVLILNNADKFSDVAGKNSYCDIDIKKFMLLEEQLRSSKHAEREKMKGLESFRVDAIVPAAFFTRYILKKCNLRQFRMTTHSLKDGIDTGRMIFKPVRI
ncbi:MAG: exopolyphosphatase [Bacteroidia bacterium]|nr:exopolyphosphatase [Bacteroidia bacterium]